MHILFAIFLFVFGSTVGSFLGAMIWRLHDFRETSSAKSRKMWRGFWGLRNEFSRKFLRSHPGKNQRALPEKYRRSYCETCGHELSVLDLIPILSFAKNRGKCVYCGEKIGISALLIELVGGFVFAFSFLFWPQDFTKNDPLIFANFAVWLVICALFVALFFYDARWKELPNVFVAPLIFFAILLAGMHFAVNPQPEFFANFALALVPVFGVYLLLFLVSAGEWIGFGDVKFGIAVALILPDIRLAVSVLVFANFAGTLLVLPGLLTKKLSRNTQIPFGPFLIAATFFIFIFSAQLIDFMNTILLI